MGTNIFFLAVPSSVPQRFQAPATRTSHGLSLRGEALSRERTREEAPRGAATCPGRVSAWQRLQDLPFQTQASLLWGEDGGRESGVRSPNAEQDPGSPAPRRRLNQSHCQPCLPIQRSPPRARPRTLQILSLSFPPPTFFSFSQLTPTLIQI